MNPLILVLIIAIAFDAGVAWGRRGRGIGLGVGRGTPVRPEGPPPPRGAHPGYRFTPEVRSALSRSREEAFSLGNEYVAPEHIRLGLIHVNSGTVARVLARLRIEPTALRTSMLGIVQRGMAEISRDLPYTSRAKRVLEKAMIAARDLNHDYVGLEHLLLGLAQDDGSVGRVLTDAGADAEAVRRETLAVLSTAFDSGSSRPAK